MLHACVQRLWVEEEIFWVCMGSKQGLRYVESNRHKRPPMADIVAELDRIKDAETLKNPSLLHRQNTLTVKSDGWHKR
jgi:hypothetical protein